MTTGTTSTTVTSNWTVVKDANGFPTVVSGGDVKVYINNSTPFFSGEAWSDVDTMTAIPTGATITDLTFEVDVQVDGARAVSTTAISPRLQFIDKAQYLANSFILGYGVFGSGGVGDLPDDNTRHTLDYADAAYATASGGGGVSDLATFAAALADPATPVILRVTGAQGATTGTGITYYATATLTFTWTAPGSDGDGLPPVTDPPPYGGGSAPPPDNGGGTGPGTGGPPPDPAGGGGYQTISVRRQAPTTAQIVIDGHWLTGLCPWGDLSWSHVWPGGSGNASWSAEQVPASLRKRGLLVQLMIGAECIWSGPQTEPDPSGLTMSAAGLWTIGPDWIALDAVGNASVIPDEAIDAAIGRGMPWKRKTSISTSAVDIDTSQGPTTIGALLDAYALDATQRWGVTPDGYVICQPDPVFPTWHVLPLDGGLTPADNFATRLFGRYYTGSTYGTAQVSSDPGNNGAREATVDLTGFGPITLAKAERKLQALLDLGLSRPSWANPIVVGYGDILSPGAVAVGLEQPIAGDLVRVHGHIDETQSVGGAMWTDVLMGQTYVSDETLTLTPMDMPARTLADVLALAAQSKKGA